MWWKLGLLITVAFAASVAVVPIRTHAVIYKGQSTLTPGLRQVLSNMYFTPSAVCLIVAILGVTLFFAFRIVRLR